MTQQEFEKRSEELTVKIAQIKIEVATRYEKMAESMERSLQMVCQTLRNDKTMKGVGVANCDINALMTDVAREELNLGLQYSRQTRLELELEMLKHDYMEGCTYGTEQ